jgi:hypothetical protein
VHRGKRDIYDNIRLLVEAAGRTVPPLDKVQIDISTPKAACKRVTPMVAGADAEPPRLKPRARPTTFGKVYR